MSFQEKSLVSAQVDPRNRRWGKNEMPGDIAVDTLSDEQMRELKRLKDWLYRKRAQARLERDRAERKQRQEESLFLPYQKGAGPPPKEEPLFGPKAGGLRRFHLLHCSAIPYEVSPAA